MSNTLIVNKQLGYTGLCDVLGNKIYIGDRVRFTNSNGAVWSATVCIYSGVITVNYLDAQQLKNPHKWTRQCNWIDTDEWYDLVGMLNANTDQGIEPNKRPDILTIAGNFATPEQQYEALQQFKELNNELSAMGVHSAIPVYNLTPHKIKVSTAIEDLHPEDIIRRLKDLETHLQHGDHLHRSFKADSARYSIYCARLLLSELF